MNRAAQLKSLPAGLEWQIDRLAETAAMWLQDPENRSVEHWNQIKNRLVLEFRQAVFEVEV